MLPTSGARVYQWVDAEGNTQFSDRPPEVQAAPEVALKAETPPSAAIEVAVIPVGLRLSDEDRTALAALPQTIHRILAGPVGGDLPPVMTLGIRVLPDRPAFDKHLGRDTTGLLLTGVYVREDREIVTFSQGDRQGLEAAVAREGARALMTSAFPYAPRWLSSGLISYFAELRVTGDARVVHPDPSWQPHAGGASRPDLTLGVARLVDLSDREWHRMTQGDARLSNHAWSFVYYLMSTPHGAGLIGAILDSGRDLAADDRGSSRLIDRHFEGGLVRLEEEWHAWMYTRKAAHYY